MDDLNSLKTHDGDFVIAKQSSFSKNNFDDRVSDVFESNFQSAIWEHLRNFAMTTSAHGYKFTLTTRSMLRRIIYFIFLLASIIAVIYFCARAADAYKETRQVTQISHVKQPGTEFPTVVVCNENMIRKSKMGELLYKLNITDLKLSDKMEREALLDFIIDLNLSEAILKPFAHQFNTTVVKCRFKNNKNCLSNYYWQDVWHYNYGLCFIFNSVNKYNPSAFYTNSESHGLHLTINADEQEYNDDIEIAGMRMFIVNPGEYYFQPKNEILLQPGVFHAIPLHKVVRKIIQNGSCVMNKQLTLQHNVASNTKYTKDLCFLLCLNRKLVKTCSCIGRHLPKDKEFKNIPPCSKSHETKICASNVTQHWRFGQIQCNPQCRAQCQTVKLGYRLNTQKCRNFGNFSRDFLKVSIYFEDLGFTLYEDKTFISPLVSLISHLGGVLAFFSGWSLVTIIEVFALLCQLVWAILGKMMRHKKMRKFRNKQINIRQPFLEAEISCEV